MILIADSGATKADWKLIDGGKIIYSCSTAGLSPLFWTSAEMTAEIKKKFSKKILSRLSKEKFKIHFYGTSCSSKTRIRIVRNALKKVFPKALFDINHDILASARALCGHGEGIACILGTGSNSCHYDGKKITKIIGGLTYIIGDEGSGAHIGLELIRAFLNKELPEDLDRKFFNQYRLTKEKVTEAIYHKKYPNRFLASFSEFAGKNIADPFVKNLVKKCIELFFNRSICRYNNYTHIPVGFVGSIAYYFADVLREVAEEKSVTINKIIKAPIDELVKFHSVHG